MKIGLILLLAGAFALGVAVGGVLVLLLVGRRQREFIKSLHASGDALDRAVKSNQQPKDKQ